MKLLPIKKNHKYPRISCGYFFSNETTIYGGGTNINRSVEFDPASLKN